MVIFPLALLQNVTFVAYSIVLQIHKSMKNTNCDIAVTLGRTMLNPKMS